MHPVLASGTALASFLLFLVYAFTVKPVYEAEAVLYEQPEPPRLLEESSTANFDTGRYESFLQEQILTMQRPDTISQALTTLPRSTWAEYGSSPEMASEGVLASLKVARVTTSYQVALTLKGSNPKNITQVVNAVAETYLRSVHKQAQTEIDARMAILAEERVHVANQLRKAQEEQSALSASLGVANPNGEGDPYETELAALREQLVQARGAHDAVAAQLSSLGAQGQPHDSGLAAAADEIILGDAGLASLKSSINEKRATLRGQMAGMTPDNPLRQRNQEELAELDHTLQEMTATLHAKAERNLQQKLRSDLQRTADVQERINRQLAQRTVAATSSTPKLQRAAELSTDLKRLLLRQAEVDDALRSLQLQESSPGAARLAIAAQIPSTPERSRRRMILLASFPLALFFGAVAAAIARRCDPKIYGSVDVENVLGFPPIASLPVRGERANALVEADILRLAGSIETACCTKGLRTFLLTAVSSQTDIGPLSRLLLERLRRIGVQACLTTTAALILPRHVDGPGDAVPADASEASNVLPCPAQKPGFANENLALLMEQHSLILIEAATLVDSAEAEYVARCAHATILIAQNELTTRTDLKRAADLLERLQVPGVGVVLQGGSKDSRRDKAEALLSHPGSTPSIAVVEGLKQRGKSDLPATSVVSPLSAGEISLEKNNVRRNLSDVPASSMIRPERPVTDEPLSKHAERGIPQPTLNDTVVEQFSYHADLVAHHLSSPGSVDDAESTIVPSVSSPSAQLDSIAAVPCAFEDQSQPDHESVELSKMMEADPLSFRKRSWHSIPPLRPAKQGLRDRPDDAAYFDRHLPTAEEFQCQTSKMAVSAFQQEELAQQEDRLTRQWRLLSRFQQANDSRFVARSTKQTRATHTEHIHANS